MPSAGMAGRQRQYGGGAAPYFDGMEVGSSVPITEFVADNPLLAAGMPLLGLIWQLRVAVHIDDVAALRERAVSAVGTFESRCAELGATAEQVRAARYVLCTVIDEVVLNLPWGHDSIWSTDSLLVTFYNDTLGGERFFVLLESLLRDPARNRAVLELMYVCLRFGFQGRYALLERGPAELQRVERSLYDAIVSRRGNMDGTELSEQWQAAASPRRRLSTYVPLWVVPVVAAVALVGAYAAMSLPLSRSSDLVFAEMQDLSPVPSALAERVPPPTPPVPASDLAAMRKLLQPEIEQNRLDVVDRGSVLRIIVFNHGLFAPGQDMVSAEYRPVFMRIADAVKDRPGLITVGGHTDNQPIIRSLRFPSNYDLSRARARGVAAILAPALTGATTVVYEGHGENEPLVRNDSPEGLQANRRVEIDVPKLAPRS
jgi:type VI secretion system protein ImpK